MLQAVGLHRSFGDFVAVEDATFDVPSGRLVGFVGGNGAGKTTTMRMLMGVLTPDHGEVLFNGEQITGEQRAKIGYMPEERGLYPKQTLISQLAYIGELKGLNRSEAKREASEHLDRFGLGERKSELLESLSLGNQQRVQIIAAVIGSPIALILDEPFSGLDPEAIDEMADVLRQLAELDVPVLFSSHQLDLVDRLCDEIVVLAKGNVVAKGTAEQLRESAPIRYRLVAGEKLDWLTEQPGLTIVEQDECQAILEFSNEESASDFLQLSVNHTRVRNFARLKPTLSEIYQEVTL